ncbi:hypothetical protein [Ramlibacter sp.]|uniref:hypothetical protein n=1 Tax=Ramlibacter sp. TaxID=1917967 RepID=UPI0035AE141F
MHAAPPARFPAAGGRRAAALLGIVWLLGGAATAAWTAATPDGPRLVLAWLTWLVAGWLAWRGWLALPRGELAWDGGAWRWNTETVAAMTAPTVVLDFQASLLLHWADAPAGLRWLWLERADAPGEWAGLRRAVYSPPRFSGPDGTAPPAAGP